MTLNERLAYPLRAKPELCSINMGTMNFAFHKAARGVVGWKHPWEKPYVEGSEDRVSRNTFGDIRTILAELGDQHGVRFAFECYDVGQLHNLAHCVEEGLVKGPLIQCALGILGGIGPEPESLLVMRSTADRLFGRRNYEFSVLGVGRHQISLVAMGAIMGGHVRVGLEDSLFLSRGLLATSCAAQVLKIRRILEELSLDIASPAEAREILRTKGADKVRFDVEATATAPVRLTRRPRSSLLEPIVLAVTLALIVLFALTTPGFATRGNLSVILSNSTSLILLSCGMAVVVISRGLDLSQVAAMVAGATTYCT